MKTLEERLENIKEWFFNAYRHGGICQNQPEDPQLDRLGFNQWWNERKEFILEDLES